MAESGEFTRIEFGSAVPALQSERAPTASRTASPSTKGEEVLTTLYQKACEDRDSLAATNTMYSKMLEACAEQNNIAEKAAEAAKKQAADAIEAADKAEHEKNDAVLKLQTVESDSILKITQLEAALSASEAAGAEKVSSIQSEHRVEVNKLATDVQRLADESTELRKSFLEASSQSAFMPRMITLGKNEVRVEMAKKLAAASAELASQQQQAHTAAVQAQAEKTAAIQRIELLQNEVSDLKAALLESENKRIQAENAALAKVAEKQREVEAAADQVREWQQVAALARQERDEVMTNAQAGLNEREAAFTAELAAQSNARAAAEAKFAERIAQLSQQFQQSITESEAAKDKLVAELETTRAKLEGSNAEASTARRELSAATRVKNTALKELRDSMLADAAEVTKTLDKRSQELAALQTIHNETLAKEKGNLAEVAAVQRSQENAADAEIQAQGVISSLQKDLAEKDAALVSLNEQVRLLEEAAAGRESDAYASNLATKMEGQQLADRVAHLSSVHQQERQALREDFSESLAAAKAELDEVKQAVNASAAKMQEVVQYNATVIADAKTAKEEHDALVDELNEMQLKVKTLEDEASSPGQKRRRK